MTQTAPLISESLAFLDVMPQIGGSVVLLALVILTAYTVESIKHARKRRPKPHYRRTAKPQNRRPRELEIHPRNGQAL